MVHVLDRYNPFIRLARRIGGPIGWVASSLLLLIALVGADYVLLYALTHNAFVLMVVGSGGLAIMAVMVGSHVTALRLQFTTDVAIADRLMRLRRLFHLCFQPHHLVRTCTIAFVIGTWLTGFNQGDVILAGRVTPTLGLKVFLNYLTPFVVANLGLLSRET